MSAEGLVTSLYLSFAPRWLLERAGSRRHADVSLSTRSPVRDAASNFRTFPQGTSKKGAPQIDGKANKQVPNLIHHSVAAEWSRNFRSDAVIQSLRARKARDKQHWLGGEETPFSPG